MTIYWHKAGNGKNVIIGLHGWIGSHRTYAPMNDIKDKDYCLLGPDLPGYGESQNPTSFDIEEIADSLAESILGLPEIKSGNNSICILGSCSGALIAFHLAKRLDKRVSHLVLLDPFAKLPWYLRLLTLKGIGRLCYHLAFVHSWGQSLAARFLPQGKNVASTLERAFRDVNHQTTQAYLTSFAARNPLSDFLEFSRLSVDIDFVFGEKTFSAVLEGVPLWTEIFPEARIHRVGNTGHFLIDEATETIAKMLFRKKKILAKSGRLDRSSRLPLRELTDSRSRHSLGHKGESICPESQQSYIS